MPASSREKPGAGRLAEWGKGRWVSSWVGHAAGVRWGRDKWGVPKVPVAQGGLCRELALSQHCRYPTHLTGLRAPRSSTLGGVGHRARS